VLSYSLTGPSLTLSPQELASPFIPNDIEKHIVG